MKTEIYIYAARKGERKPEYRVKYRHTFEFEIIYLHKGVGEQRLGNNVCCLSPQILAILLHMSFLPLAAPF